MATPQYHQYQDGSKARLVGRELTITDAGMKLVIKQARNGYFRRTIQSRSYSLGERLEECVSASPGASAQC